MTAWTLQIDPSAAISNRAMLDLNSGPIRVGGTGGGVGVDWGQAAVTAYMTQQGQFGNSPSTFVIPNRTITIPLLLGADDSGTEEIVRSHLQQKVALLQREGGVLLRQRDGGQAMYADIVDAQLTVPDVFGETGGVEPGVSLMLDCLPDFYGDEITLDSIAATGYCAEVLKEGGVPAIIEGDYPARCRIAVTPTDPSFEIVWGVRSRHYSVSDPIIANPSAMTVFGTLTTVAQSQNAQVATTTATASGRGIGPGASIASYSSHLIGTYRVLARVRSHVTTTEFLIEWTTGAQVIDNTPVVVTYFDEFTLLDLGVVTVAPLPPALPAPTLTVTAIAAGSGETVSLDYLAFVCLDESAGAGISPAQVGAHKFECLTEGVYAMYNSGTIPVPIGNAIGDLPRLPPSGLEDRPVELFVTAPLGESSDYLTTMLDPYPHALTVDVSYRPCWLGRP